MANSALAVVAYIEAKDGNRPWLMRQVFAADAVLEMVVKTDAISFPSSATGRDEIAEVLVRRFSSEFENVYTLCLSSPPEPDAHQFTCDWLVGMSRRDDCAVRIGCGQYDWVFGSEGVACVDRLTITIEEMQALDTGVLPAVMQWLAGLSYPWCPVEQAISRMPPLEELAAVRQYIARNLESA